MHEVVSDKSDLFVSLQNKKKSKRKQKKVKNEVDLLLETYIAENKTWPKQLEMAISTIRCVVP